MMTEPQMTRGKHPKRQLKAPLMRSWSLIGGLLFLLGGTYSFFSIQALQEKLAKSVALGQGAEFTSMLAEFRTLYTSEVVSRAKSHGMEITHDYQSKEGAIPLPATLSLLLAEAINAKNIGGTARLYSDHPFPWREEDGGVKDKFERSALEFFRKNKSESFHWIEDYNGVQSLRYAVPDRMRESCVNCHNSHPDSPKTDWKVGDVRGVLEVILPMDSAIASISNGLKQVWLLMGSIGGASILFFGLTNLRLRKQAHTIIQNSDALTLEMRKRLQTEKEKAQVEELVCQLTESEAKVRSIVETAAEGILTINTENSLITTFNPAAERIFGFSAVDVVGENVSILIPDEERRKIFTQVSANKRITEESLGLHQDGTAFPILMSISEFAISGSHSYTVVVRDLTEQKELEAQLLQAQKLESIGQLAAGIAHEINTPTQFVTSNLTFLDESFGELKELLVKYQQLKITENSAELFSEIETVESKMDVEFLVDEIPRALNESLDGVNRIATIVRAMKEFSHPSTTEKTLTDLNKAIDSTITVAQSEWKYVAKMEVDLDPDLPMVPCLLGEFNQVVLNIIVNAVHAIADNSKDSNGKKGLIRVRTTRDGDWALVEISDNGPGIPEKIRNKVFDPFFTTKEVGKGTGQGLSIAHSVVADKHAGRLDVSSEMGKGTTFHIRLPLSDGDNDTKEVARGKGDGGII